MSKHQKNTSLSILYVLLLTIFGSQSSNSASAFKLKDPNLKLEIEKDKYELDNSKSAIYESDYSSSKVKNNTVFQADLKVLEDKNKIQFNSPIKNALPAYLNSVTEDLVETEKLIADVSVDTSTDRNSEDDKIENEPNIGLDLIRKVSLFFFLLFFLPLGVFYPLFLLYRKLLNIDEDTKPLEEDIFENSLPISSPREDVELDLDSEQTTISKLQVAFLPKVINLKQQLEQVSLNIDKQSHSEALDLMRSAISIFITQQHWTHAGCESTSFSSVEAQEQFDTILSTEQDKCFDRKLSFVNVGQQQQKPENHNANDTFRYTVVTMVFHTAGSNILFEPIGTKENLAKLLIDLSQLNGDDLLNFELIWNPLKEDEFITNEQLLMHYEDMVRLF